MFVIFPLIIFFIELNVSRTTFDIVRIFILIKLIMTINVFLIVACSFSP